MLKVVDGTKRVQSAPLAHRIKFTGNLDYVRSMDELKFLVDKIYNDDKVFGFDIETGYSGSDYEGRALNYFHPLQFIAGFSISNDPRWARYIPLKHDFFDGNLNPEEVWSFIKPLLEEKVGVAHNLNFEAGNLRQIERAGDGPRIEIPLDKWHDSQIQAYVLSDVPTMPVSGSRNNGEFVKRYIPEFHQTSDGFMASDPALKNGKPAYDKDGNPVMKIRQFGIGLKALTRFRYNYKQAEIHSLFRSDGKDMTAKQRKSIRFNVLPVDHKVVHYACDDAYLCLQLHLDQYPAIMEDPFLAQVYNLEMQTAQVLVDMREPGVAVDWEGLEHQKVLADSFVHEMELMTRRQFEQETGRELPTLNLSSPQQISKLIFTTKEEGGLGFVPSKTTDAGAASTSDDALVLFKRESKAVNSLLKFRQSVKQKQWVDMWCTYSDQSFDGRLHPSFIQTRIQSGRFASAEPNVQTLSKWWWFQTVPGSTADVMRTGELGKDFWYGNARQYITASPGYTILSFDYKSAEIQMLAALAQETDIIDAFYSGDDFHKWTAAMVWHKSINEVTKAERQNAKAVSFGLAYQQSAPNLAAKLGISRQKGEEIFDNYFARFPRLSSFVDEMKDQVGSCNEIRTWLGRRAVVWESMHDNKAIMSKSARMAVNIPVQGGATGDYTKLAMVRSRDVLRKKGWWGNEVRLLMNQHDSLVFEVSNDLDLEEVVELLQPAVQFSLAGFEGYYGKFDRFPPMSVDWEVGPSFGEVYDMDKRGAFEASKVTIEIDSSLTPSDFKALLDSIVTNPGSVPVEVVHDGKVLQSDYKVKPSPATISKIAKGDPDIGIIYKEPDKIRVSYS